MTYSHRLARPDDLPAIVDIYNCTIPSRTVTADLEPVTVESRRLWFDEHTPDHRPLWVVDDGRGGLMGWLSYSDFNRRPAYAGTVELSIYLHEHARGRGLGRYLLQEAIDYAPRIGAHTLVGLIFGHNQRSLALFDSFGFARWALMPQIAEMDGSRYDLVIVGRRVA